MILVYVKTKRFVQVVRDDVQLRDLAEVRCRDTDIEKQVNRILVHHFPESSTGKDGNRIVISALVFVRLIEELYPEAHVELSGEPSTLVQRIPGKPENMFSIGVKIVLVCLISFFGTAFTIMAYHNDIGIVMLFREVYHIFMGYYPEGPNVLETSYSIGLGLGIILFYNHIGKRKLTKDPTPIEVAMYQYEQDVDYALIDLADRQGTEKEADA